MVAILLHQHNLQKYTLHTKHGTARILQIWSSMLCFGVVSCSLFAANLYPLSFAVRRGKEMLLSVSGSTLQVLKYVPGCSIRHCTLQIVLMGIWKAIYFLICSCSTSFTVSCSYEFLVFSLIPVRVLQVLKMYILSLKEGMLTFEPKPQPLDSLLF